jgi:hypothetical protein
MKPAKRWMRTDSRKQSVGELKVRICRLTIIRIRHLTTRKLLASVPLGNKRQLTKYALAQHTHRRVFVWIHLPHPRARPILWLTHVAVSEV